MNPSNSSIPRSSNLICLATFAAFLPWQSAQAATGTWTGTGGAMWDTTNTHWTGVSGTPWDSTNGLTDTALFSAAATPTVSGTVYVNTLTINAATTISGGTLTLAGSSPTINGTGAGTIYSVLAGTNGLIKSGTGSAVLDPGNGWWENTFSGDITVNGGTLTTVRTTSLGNDGVGAGTITVNAGATLSVEWSNITRTGLVTVDGGTFSTNSYGPAGIINNGAGFLFKNAASVSAILGGSAGLTVEGAGVTYLWRQATYTGATTINGGQLAIAGVGGIAATSAVSIASGASINLTSSYAPDNINRTIGGLTGAGVLYGAGTGTVTVNKTSGTDTFGGDIQGTQGLIKDGAGTLQLTGTNTYTGNTTVSNGVLAVGGAGKLGSGSYSGAVSLASASSALQIATSASQTLSGAISGSGSLAKSGNGTLTLSGSNSYLGNTTISGGNLIASHANALGNAASAVTVSGGGWLDVRANMTRTGTVTIDAAVLTGGGSAVTLTNNGGGYVFKNASTIAGAVTLAGSGGLTVNGGRVYLYSNPTYTGATVIAAGGDLALGGGGSLPTNTTVDLLGNFLVGNANNTIGGLTGNGSTGRLIGGSSYTFTVNKTSGTDSYGGSMESISTFIKSGAGTLSLTNATNNTNFPGALTVNNGVLELGGAGKWANGSYSGAVSLAGASSVLGIATSANQTLGGAIGGSGSLAKSGTGTLTLSGSNSYAGGTTVNAGTLTASHANALGDAAGAVTVNSGGTLLVNANMTCTDTVTLNGGDMGGNGSTLTNNGSGYVLMGSYASTGNVVLAGSSGLTNFAADGRLWAQATYSGATTVNSGSLNICGSGGIPTTSPVSIASGAQINLTSYSAPTNINRMIGGLTGAGLLYGGGGTVTVNKTSGTDTFSGGIQGTQGLIKDGAGTLALSGSNTYTGATTVSAGTLLVTGALASNVSVSDGAILDGGGTVGALSFAGNSFFDIFLAIGGAPNPLDATGTISFSGTGFGIDNLVSQGSAVNWGGIADGTYTLITGTLNTTHLANLGLANAFDIDGPGGNRTAYFQNGSLQMVVVPEPRAALLGGLGMLMLLRRRRCAVGF